jgi:hypothetical protein
MFTVKAPDGKCWVRPSLLMAKKFAWRKSWLYPANGSLSIFKGKTLLETQIIWRGYSEPERPVVLNRPTLI